MSRIGYRLEAYLNPGEVYVTTETEPYRGDITETGHITIISSTLCGDSLVFTARNRPFTEEFLEDPRCCKNCRDIYKTRDVVSG